MFTNRRLSKTNKTSVSWSRQNNRGYIISRTLWKTNDRWVPGNLLRNQLPTRDLRWKDVKDWFKGAWLDNILPAVAISFDRFFHILIRHLDHMHGRFDLSPSAVFLVAFFSWPSVASAHRPSSCNTLNIGLEREDFSQTLKKGRGNLYSALHGWISPEGVQNTGRGRRKGGGMQTKDIINGDASQCVHLPCEKNDYLDCLWFPSCSLV